MTTFQMRCVPAQARVAQRGTVAMHRSIRFLRSPRAWARISTTGLSVRWRRPGQDATPALDRTPPTRRRRGRPRFTCARQLPHRAPTTTRLQTWVVSVQRDQNPTGTLRQCRSGHLVFPLSLPLGQPGLSVFIPCQASTSSATSRRASACVRRASSRVRSAGRDRRRHRGV